MVRWPEDARWASRTLLALPQEVAGFMAPYLADRPGESMAALYVDARHRLSGADWLGHGDELAVEIDLKVLVRGLSYAMASGVVLAHNHPAGDPRPSEDDKALTKRVRAICELLNVTLMDHVIVGAFGRYYSFAESRRL